MCTPGCHLGRARVSLALRVPPGAEPVGRAVTLRGAVGVWPPCPGAVCGRTARRASVGERVVGCWCSGCWCTCARARR